MQLTLVVPIVSMVLWKIPALGYVLCIILIMFNITYNMYMTNLYNLKVGFINVHNWEMLQAVIGKPWCHL